jgi:superoxide reductase
MERDDVFKCEVCGNIVQLLHSGGGTLICCGKPMVKLEENTEDEGYEKHVPVVEKTDNGYKVKVGDVPHPMDDDHYIQWIEIIADGVSYRQYLNPGEKPEAEFCIDAVKVTAREFCNVHGQWKSK